MSFLRLDADAMADATAAMPDHIAAALSEPPGLPDGLSGERPSLVVVAGMGGSGVAGRVLEALAAGSSPVPVLCAGGYLLPAFAGPGSLVVAVSFSGETEETIEVAAAALERGAALVAITSGGRLARLAEGAGAPISRLPAGISRPRAAVAAMTAPLLLLAGELGLFPDARSSLESCVSQLHKRVAECAGGGGIARRIAEDIGRSIPLVHGAAGLGEVAARRFKTQVNENAKAMSFSGAEPEVCHNEICGFGQHGDITRQLVTLVNVRLGDEHPQVARRFELFAELAGEALAGVVDLEADGETPLARFFDAVAVGDYVSLHLAANEDVDPGPNPVLDEIKERLDAGR